MSVAELKVASPPPPRSGATMDRKIERPKWHPLSWPLGVRVGAGAGGAIVAVLLIVAIFAGSGMRTVRLPAQQVTIATVEQSTFHDFTVLRSTVVPRETVFIDATDGGRVDRVLVQAGDFVQTGQPMIEFSNTNLQLNVINQESQLNQSIAAQQQQEINLETGKLQAERVLAETEYNLTRLEKSAARREELTKAGAISAEEGERIRDELAHYRRILPILREDAALRKALRDRLLPNVQAQLKRLQENLSIVRNKLDALTVRAPVAGRVTQLDLRIGENKNPGTRLAEVTPDNGVKLVENVDQHYLGRVTTGLKGTVDVNGVPVPVTTTRVYPQVKEGRFAVDLNFVDADPKGLVSGQTVQGRLQLGDDTQAMILKVGPFLEQSGGDWVFVLEEGGDTALRRRIKIGRRNFEQLEVLSGLQPGDRVITSDYTGLDRIEQVILTK